MLINIMVMRMMTMMMNTVYLDSILEYAERGRILRKL